ncbi:hypothetical protein LINPERPRIM_LOCUS11780 [Linum perenne]
MQRPEPGNRVIFSARSGENTTEVPPPTSAAGDLTRSGKRGSSNATSLIRSAERWWKSRVVDSATLRGTEHPSE